ncbi:MAG: beta-ketoacyl-[acyl-carrier-protein] synthase family protein [Planctomycetota bacterium]|jgi:3-oxoacyl-[acyl-carrier-protein] synthase II
MTRRVVITGIGLSTPIGSDKNKYWDNLINGRSGISTIKRFDATALPSQIGGEVTDADFDKYIPAPLARKMSRTSKLAVVAAKQALTDSALELTDEIRENAGILLGVASADAPTFASNVIRRFKKGSKGSSPIWPGLAVVTAPTGNVAISLGIEGEAITISTGCSSSTNAIGHAYRKIKFGMSDLIFSGGSDVAVQEDFLAGYGNANSLSRRNDSPEEACRPFERDRDGQVLGEGAGILVLEEYEHARKRNAHIYAEIVGYGSTNDAQSMLMVSESHKQAARSISNAIKESNMSGEKIGYYCAHGSSSIKTDVRETRTLKEVLKKSAYRLPISSIKSMVGHPFGASGALQTATCAMTIDKKTIPPTINYENPAPDCDLDYVPNEARRKKVDRVQAGIMHH